MSKDILVRAGALYFPIVLAAIAGFVRGRQQKMFAACLLGTLWVAASLPLLERLNEGRVGGYIGRTVLRFAECRSSFIWDGLCCGAFCHSLRSPGFGSRGALLCWLHWI
jgi:hypothetical protein